MKIAAKVRTVIRAALLLPLFILAIAVAIVAGVVGRKRDLRPEEFAEILRRIADEKIDDGEWDEFECSSLKDERLEAIRLRSFPFCGRPGPVDGDNLRRLAAEAEALA